MNADFDPQLVDPVNQIVDGRVSIDVVGRSLTTFAIGGVCEAVVTVADERELQEVLSLLHRENQPIVMLGFGSNVLIPDAGVSGWIVRLGGDFKDVRALGASRFSFGAAASLIRESRQLSQGGYSGLEFAAGIPGSFGGGVFMNAGAHGSELGERVSAVRGFFADGMREEIKGHELPWKYRSAGLPSKFFVTEVILELAEGDPCAINEECRKNLAHRKATQPLTVPSAGSVFKNPSVATPAGKVLEQAGLKGRRIGEVFVSEMHANWIVNPSKRGSSKDVQALIELCISEVKKHAGITLEPEVRLWKSV